MAGTTKLTRGIDELLAAAEPTVRSIEAEAAIALVGNPEWLIVDVRDARERARDGYIPGSFHCPRGMVEFWIDPQSPYFKPALGEAPNLLFHCALDWRSTLTVNTVQEMGVDNAFHIRGGLKAWKEANGPLVRDDR